MTLLDDDIDDLLRAFRADEALLDDTARSRMWARIGEEVADASTALDALDPSSVVRPLRRRMRPGDRVRLRVLGVAAAVLVLLAVGGLAIRSGGDDGTVTAGPTTGAVGPMTLQQLADIVAVRTVPILGSSDDTLYSHQLMSRSTRSSREVDPIVRTEERWVGRDGTGRQVRSGPGEDDQLLDDPGTLSLGGLDPELAVDVPDDPDVIEARMAEADQPAGPPTLIGALSFAGLPAPARAGLLRLLDRFGFVPVSTPGVRPNLLRVEGSGPDGSLMQADLDLLTGHVVASATFWPNGGNDMRTYTQVDLRADRGR